MNFHDGQFSNIVFLNEFRVKNVTFTSHIDFKQLIFSANVVKTMSNSIRSFVKSLEDNGFNDYAAELAEFYLNDLNNSKNKEEFDIAIKSDWVNIKQAASILGLSYNTLLTMRKEDKADGIMRIPYRGEGKSTRYYVPLLKAYKSKDMNLVKELEKEIGYTS